MTAQLLTSELSTLIQESKRKSPDLRSAADKSLNDLKSLPRTSEKQIAADLKSRPSFVKPFLLACSTRNAKFAGSGITGLQRLVVANALPKEVLADVLEAFRECATLALDIQLKVLQALPSLLQNYANSLSGKLLVAAFEVCFLLYNNKTAVVSNTAAAALQQLVNTTFEKAVSDDDDDFSQDEVSVEVSTGDGEIPIHGAVLDTYQLLEDICLMTDGQRPKFLLGATLAQNFGLELLESILANHADTVVAHPEQIHILRSRLMPLIVRILSERASFSSTVRTMRLLQLIFSRLLFALAPECEITLSLLNHMLDPDAATPWKRVLCLELFKSIHSEPALIRSIYAHYDEADEKRNIVRDHLGALVRLAAEKPQLMGLGQQSSMTISNQNDDSGEQAALQAGGLVGSIGTSATSTDMNRPGISVQWSTIRTPCIEQLDKTEPPNLPATYVYSLTLICITRFSEGLARFLLPFTVPVESKAKRRQTALKDTDANENDQAENKTPVKQNIGFRRLPVNPMSLKEHVLYSQICTSARMVDHCWPALLAASSTYLNATMDSENYHILIRSFQKFTQIAGLLDFATPRDAFLTTLGKHAAPAIKGTAPSPEPNGREHTLGENFTDRDGDTSPAARIRQHSVEGGIPTMNTRHLLCLRALLNLGIALGPVLKSSWTIILETLLQADFIISSSGKALRKQSKRSVSKAESEAAAEKADGTEDLGLEVIAAETAASRMFESTTELPNEAFLDFIKCLCSLLQVESPLEQQADGLIPPNPASRKHQKARSVSGIPKEGEAVVQSNGFVIDKIDAVAQSNLARMLQPETLASGWNLILEVLTSVLSSGKARSDIRVKAAHAYNELVIAVAVSDESLPRKGREEIRGRSLTALRNEVSALHLYQGTKSSRDCEVEIHRLALEALKAVIDHCGDSLEVGWGSVLAIINSIFESNDPEETAQRDDLPPSYRISPNSKLVRSAFGSLQLICSDFLSSVPPTHLLLLLDTLYYYCVQTQDLNISLTTATLFRNVSNFLQRDNTSIRLNFLKSSSPMNEELARWAKSEDSEEAMAAMWLYLLYRITMLSTDSRLEVRHSALHTLFRIFDACSDQLAPEALRICFDSVLGKLIKSNVLQHHHANKTGHSETTDDAIQAWNETAIVEIEGVSNLFSQWIDTYKQDEGLAIMCKDLLDLYTDVLGRRTLSVSNAVFAGTNKILSEVESRETVDQNLIHKAWELWGNGNPTKHMDNSKRQSGNQDAVISYLECLRQNLRLTGGQVSPQRVESILKQLFHCVVHLNASAYSSDVDRLTPVQGLVLEGIKSIPVRSAATFEVLVQSITGLITLAYEQPVEAAAKQHTYVALSKAGMALLESYILKNINMPDVDALNIVSRASKALALPIHLKYKWNPEGKAPSPWSKATTTALSILEVSMPVVQAIQHDKQESSQPWEVVITISDCIMGADCDACSDWETIPQDEDFDIEAFSRIKKLLIPVLGSSSIPDTIRRKYAESVFQNSVIHEPHPDDLARPGQELLEGLRSTHIGRVNDLPPSPRSRMSYLLLDELFSLVAVHDGSPERIRLAQAAAPYLILRSGLTLKAYAMDNPLRGRMPQPWSQRKEMLYMLQKLVELNSEPKAIPAAPGVLSEYKKHLHRLYGLVMKALEAAWRDDEMQEALRKVLDAVGDDFGL